ncbi:hypothetical protein ASE75_13605 [Sphingomonas sp. Leaf17]|uniref:hypothetical protein n=1 Tax=Sphingomonas sp. Leaf17 TaxID=1735683 RepID=UPI0006F3AE49|nr:hypothetical protein [Sphingomonas sp. Leaf17]KQM63462.1 hypothetical protein ASE75_13605 [Sphingomonas sp. Leaf17]
MRATTITAMLLTLAACSKAPDPSGGTTEDLAAPTGIAVTAAPGVAFAYRYAFRLPPAQVARAQEGHAAACEKLGIARCRITGMRYTLVGENDVQAMLAFRLDPAIARGFGKAGVALVGDAKGTLVDAEITGTDAGGEIDRLSRERAQADTETQRIDRQLATATRANERAELQAQRAALVRDAASSGTAVAEQRDSLTATPMTFTYASGDAIRGFDASAPLTSAIDTGIASAQTTFAVVLGLIGVFAPPALALFLLWLLWRWIAPHVRRLRNRSDA